MASLCAVSGGAAAVEAAPASAVLDTVPRLCRADVPLAGVDFHCSGVLEELVRPPYHGALLEFVRTLAQCRHVPHDSLSVEDIKDALKRVMWARRSSINCRRAGGEAQRDAAMSWQPSAGGGHVVGMPVGPAPEYRATASVAEDTVAADCAGDGDSDSDPLVVALTPSWNALEPRIDGWAAAFVAARLPPP